MAELSNYKHLFEKQKVIIERMKKDIEFLEKIQKDFESQTEYIEDYDHDNNSFNDSESYYTESDSDNESIDFDESNISNNLRLALGLGTKSDFYNGLSWTPPSRSGLDNSQPIIKNERK